MSICIYQQHKTSGFKNYTLYLPVEGTQFDENLIYDRLIKTLEACGIGHDKQPLELIDMAKYESENWIVQVIIFEGQLEVL